jgi:hypothetical protein
MPGRGQIDDRQAPVSQCDPFAHAEAFVVGPTMPNPFGHLLDQSLWAEAVPSHHNPSDPTHPWLLAAVSQQRAGRQLPGDRRPGQLE